MRLPFNKEKVMKKIYIAPTTDIEKNFTVQPFMEGISIPTSGNGGDDRTDPSNPGETLSHEGVWDTEW